VLPQPSRSWKLCSPQFCVQLFITCIKPLHPALFSVHDFIVLTLLDRLPNSVSSSLYTTQGFPLSLHSLSLTIFQSMIFRRSNCLLSLRKMPLYINCINKMSGRILLPAYRGCDYLVDCFFASFQIFMWCIQQPCVTFGKIAWQFWRITVFEIYIGSDASYHIADERKDKDKSRQIGVLVYWIFLRDRGDAMH
jgi:hypothetical protein